MEVPNNTDEVVVVSIAGAVANARVISRAKVGEYLKAHQGVILLDASCGLKTVEEALRQEGFEGEIIVR